MILEYHFSFALERARPWKKLSYNSKFPIGVEYVKQKMPECLDDKGSGKCLTFLTVLKFGLEKQFINFGISNWFLIFFSLPWNDTVFFRAQFFLAYCNFVSIEKRVHISLVLISNSTTEHFDPIKAFSGVKRQHI